MSIQYFYISTGRSNAMFTLRKKLSNGRTRHYKNLGNDVDRAFQKALNFARQCGITLKTTKNEMKQNLRAIQRKSKEEIEKERKQIEENIRRHREEAERRIKEQLKNHIMPIGKYSGKHFRDIPRGYLEWMTEQEFKNDSVMDLAAAEVLEYLMDDPLPEPNQSTVIGKPKQRMEFEVTAIKKIPLEMNNPYSFRRGNETVYLTIMVDENSNCLACFSSAFKMEVGDRKRIRATVKEHTIYKDQAQTVIQRVKILE